MNVYLNEGKARLFSFWGASSRQVVHFLHINLQLHDTETVIIHIGINVILSNDSSSTIYTFYSNIRKEVDKFRSFGEKNILVFGLVYTSRIPLPTLEKTHKDLLNYCFDSSLIYVDDRNIRGSHSFVSVRHWWNIFSQYLHIFF